MKRNEGILVWVTGLAGSGKTTLSKKIVERLRNDEVTVVHIDGDEFREVMGNELGHTVEDRIKNAWRIARLCRMLTKQGAHVICSTMSLYKEIHEYNRNENSRLLEVIVEVTMKELHKRDKKELYSSNINEKDANIPGVNSGYQFPENVDVIVQNNDRKDLERNCGIVLRKINSKLD